MADFTITPADIRDIDGKYVLGVGGAAINAGMSVYKDTSNKWQKARANAAITAGSAGKVGVALTECQADGAPILVKTEGDFLAAGMTPGLAYYISTAVAGLFAPYSDVDTANGYSTLVFVALSATQARILALPTGVTV